MMSCHALVWQLFLWCPAASVYFSPKAQLPMILRWMAALALAGLSLSRPASAQPVLRAMTTPFERDTLSSAEYGETLAFYAELAARYPERCKLELAGGTDAGSPLYAFVLSRDGALSADSARVREKTVLLINNGIHAGEPCGVDASMMLARDLLDGSRSPEGWEEVVLVILPFYNAGGARNRGNSSRANQNGPRAYGFRGNARNLDLNRDFVKCDSRNARAFNRLVARWQPHLFIDTHTTNGADYQHTMSLIAGQKDKLEPPLGKYLDEELLPELYRRMADKGWDLTPYVNPRGTTPDTGIDGFLDLPRFGSGYAALHHCLGFISEAHMLKPFARRVRATYHLLVSLLEVAAAEGPRIRARKAEAVRHARDRSRMPLRWALDTTSVDSIRFKGYRAGYRPSEVSGLPRLYYDREQAYERSIPYRNGFYPTLEVDKPAAYLIPQAYEEVIDRLRWNGVQLHRLQKDTTLDLAFYTIRDLKTSSRAYEGHYLHYDVELGLHAMRRTFYRGDWVAFTDQPAVRYLVEVMEPQAPDSFFAWNFFDGILMQKEYFSSYVFEEEAARLLDAHPEWRAELEQKKKNDPDFAQNARAQLDWVYRRSPYYEPTHRLYPVGLWNGKAPLPVKAGRGWY